MVGGGFAPPPTRPLNFLGGGRSPFLNFMRGFTPQSPLRRKLSPPRLPPQEAFRKPPGGTWRHPGDTQQAPSCLLLASIKVYQCSHKCLLSSIDISSGVFSCFVYHLLVSISINDHILASVDIHQHKITSISVH